jgi:RNA polymerase sigma-70 factor (ECF subfamily)
LLEASFLQGYTHAELAERTGMQLGTIKSRIRRALLKLRDLLEDT